MPPSTGKGDGGGGGSHIQIFLRVRPTKSASPYLSLAPDDGLKVSVIRMKNPYVPCICAIGRGVDGESRLRGAVTCRLAFELVL
jgi:hypothetical protein